MKKETQFNIALLFVIAGLVLIGWGVGRIFDHSLEGIIIGAGLGLTFSASTLLRVFRRRDAYEKK